MAVAVTGLPGRAGQVFPLLMGEDEDHCVVVVGRRGGKALDLHEFRYNGLDREGDVSRYVDVASVERDVMDVVRFIRGRTT